MIYRGMFFDGAGERRGVLDRKAGCGCLGRDLHQGLAVRADQWSSASQRFHGDQAAGLPKRGDRDHVHGFDQARDQGPEIQEAKVGLQAHRVDRTFLARAVGTAANRDYDNTPRELRRLGAQSIHRFHKSSETLRHHEAPEESDQEGVGVEPKLGSQVHGGSVEEHWRIDTVGDHGNPLACRLAAANQRLEVSRGAMGDRMDAGRQCQPRSCYRANELAAPVDILSIEYYLVLCDYARHTEQLGNGGAEDAGREPMSVNEVPASAGDCAPSPHGEISE